jgi:hypothetical protein
MSYRKPEQPEVKAVAQPAPRGFIQWLQDPMGSIVASSVAVIGSFGFVLSGTWFIQLALN